MKKCLLFIFVFGITFSLWNVKAFADTVNYNNAVWLYGNITGSSNPDNDRWFLVESQGNNGEIVLTKNNSQIYYYGLIFDATPGIYTGNRLNSSYVYYVKSYVLGGGHISYYGSGQPDLIGFDSVEEYEEFINPTPPLDIYQCAYFFEPEPNTDLFSMYCFPLELNDNEVITIYYNNINNIGFEITSASINILKRCYLESGSNIEYYHSIEYWLEMIDSIKLESENSIEFLFTTPIYAMYCNFIENTGNPNYNIFPLTEESWWDDIVNLIGFDDTTLGFIWEWLFGDPDPDYHSVTIDNSPSPTPLPTPIPYRTTLKPDGNGGYEFQYEYEDSNGNPITASAPPEQPTYNGNDLVTQPVNLSISGVPISEVEGIQSLLNVIGESDADYQDGFQAIGKSFATLPKKWFMFFGIPAAIILIAGIIKSLLG